jgi:MFS family permease
MASLTLIFIARIGAGFAGATISTAQAYIADTTTLQNRAKGMALIGASFGMGFIFGPLLGYLAVPKEVGAPPGPWPGYVAAGLSLVALGLAIFKLPESLNAKSTSAARKLLDFKALGTALATPSIGPLLISLFVCIFAFANFETTLSMLVNADDGTASENIQKIQLNSPFHFNYGKVCLMFSFIGLSLTFAQGFLVRRLSGKVSEGTLATCGAVLEIAGFLLLVQAIGAGTEPFLFAALFVVVVGFAMMMPSLNSLISRRSDPEKQGAILGVGQSVSSLARILGPAVAIPMLVRGITIPYYTATGMMGLGLLLVIYSVRGGQDYGTAATSEQPLGH